MQQNNESNNSSAQTPPITQTTETTQISEQLQPEAAQTPQAQQDQQDTITPSEPPSVPTAKQINTTPKKNAADTATLEKKRKHVLDFTTFIQDEENPVLLPENSTTALYMFRQIFDRSVDSSSSGGGGVGEDLPANNDERTISEQYDVLSSVGLGSPESLIRLKNTVENRRRKVLTRMRQKDFPYPHYKQELAVYLNLDLSSRLI